VPSKSRLDGTWIGIKINCAQLGTATPRQTAKKPCGTAGFVWGHPQGLVLSGRDHRHSLRRGRFTLKTYSQGPGCSRRNVVGAGETAILMVKLMVK
jgi:hypothetical protein